MSHEIVERTARSRPGLIGALEREPGRGDRRGDGRLDSESRRQPTGRQPTTRLSARLLFGRRDQLGVAVEGTSTRTVELYKGKGLDTCARSSARRRVAGAVEAVACWEIRRGSRGDARPLSDETVVGNVARQKGPGIAHTSHTRPTTSTAPSAPSGDAGIRLDRREAARGNHAARAWSSFRSRTAGVLKRARGARALTMEASSNDKPRRRGHRLLAARCWPAVKATSTAMLLGSTETESARNQMDFGNCTAGGGPPRCARSPEENGSAPGFS